MVSDAKRIFYDFHLHSHYSRATSKDMEAKTLALWAERKGITVVGTGDFTHPKYVAELKEQFVPSGHGLFRLKNSQSPVHFLLTVEVNNIYHQGGRLRKIHTLLFAPSFEVVDKINARLARRGDLAVDGRPTFTFSAKELVKIVLDLSAECFIVPAHAWTPWFSVFGSNSGFDSLEECFGEETKHIHAIETGLSSDAAMNWRLSALDRVAVISNSDAHSPAKLGREATVLSCNLDYQEIIDAIKTKDPKRFLYTIEFFPEEGKYHYDGHRDCRINWHPNESKAHHNTCPVCGKGLTLGVLHRVEQLADRPDGYQPPGAIPQKHLIPLAEIIADAFGQGVDTKAVQEEYLRLIRLLGSEFEILLDRTGEEIARVATPEVTEGIRRVRAGKVSIVPGHDGVYGKISLFAEGEKIETQPQLSLL